MLKTLKFVLESNLSDMKGNFQNEYHHLRTNLLRVSGWLRQEVNNILEPFGITQQQFNALRILRGQMKIERKGSFSTNDLRDLLLDKSADTSRLVDRLVAKQLVSKVPCTMDSRRVDLKLTEEGQQLLARIDLKMNELDNIIARLSKEEVERLNALLDKLIGE